MHLRFSGQSIQKVYTKDEKAFQRDLKIIEDTNNKLHTLQPYFEIIQ